MELKGKFAHVKFEMLVRQTKGHFMFILKKGQAQKRDMGQRYQLGNL